MSEELKTTYIDLEHVDVTLEMRQWVNTESSILKWKIGGKKVRDISWMMQRDRIGVWLDSDTAIIFKLKFGV